MTLLRRFARRVGGQAAPASPAPASSAEPKRGDGTDLRTLVTHASADSASGRFADALARLAAGLVRAPSDPDLLMARAATLLACSRLREAADAATRAVAARPRVTDLAALLLLGRIAFQPGEHAGAEHWFREAVAAAPGAIDAHAGLAAALHAQDRIDDAIAAYARVLAIDPRHFDGLIALGNCHLDRGDLADAEARFRQAIDVDAERAVAWRFLGLALDRCDREDEAIAAHRRAVELETRHGDDVAAFLGLAASLRDAGRFAEALSTLEPNLQRLRGADAQLLYGHMLLAVGRLPEGWHHSEFRWMTEHFLARRPRYARPVWSGQDVQGKTLLLRAEQGMGDTIQFSRYAALVKALGATVHVAVPSELVTLARGIAGVDRVFTIHADEAASDFDYYVPLLSLPRVFGTQLETIPADVPYVAADPVRVAHWAARLRSDGRSLRVGLVWGGNPLNAEDRFRSLPLQALAPLAGIAGVRFYALQKGPREREAAAPPAGLDLVNLAPELADFADTAAAISQLDLVISVCTSVAHLAGALGKPLWVMLHHAADWRWLTERSDSPWYPTATLFRQTRRGEWDDVVERVKASLEAWTGRTTPDAPIHVRTVPGALPRFKRPREAPGFRAGFSAVAETRFGIVEYLPDAGDLGDSIGWYGEWRQLELEQLIPMIRKGATVVEVGSGIGAHVLALAAVLGEAGHVIACESDPLLRRILRANVAANRAYGVTIMPRRLGAASRVDAEGSCEAGAASDAAETLDDLWLDRLDWLKVNADAALPELLDGARETLWRLRPCLHVGGTSANALTPWATGLGDFGYRCWRFETPLFNPANFNRRADSLFAGRNAHAMLAIPEEIDVELARVGGVEL